MTYLIHNQDFWRKVERDVEDPQRAILFSLCRLGDADAQLVGAVVYPYDSKEYERMETQGAMQHITNKARFAIRRLVGTKNANYWIHTLGAEKGFSLQNALYMAESVTQKDKKIGFLISDQHVQDPKDVILEFLQNAMYDLTFYMQHEAPAHISTDFFNDLAGFPTNSPASMAASMLGYIPQLQGTGIPEVAGLTANTAHRMVNMALREQRAIQKLEATIKILKGNAMQNAYIGENQALAHISVDMEQHDCTPDTLRKSILLLDEESGACDGKFPQGPIACALALKAKGLEKK